MMSLPDAQRESIRKEIAAQLESLDASLTRKEKELTELDLRYQKTITAWEKWSTSLKWLLTATIGGSILAAGATFLKIDEYIDHHIANRIVKNETISYVIWLASSNRPRQ